VSPLRRSFLPLLVIVLAGLGLRVSYLVSNPLPESDGGLVATQGEMARNIVDRGRWFVIDNTAVSYVERLQQRRHRLIDPRDVDYRPLDAHARWQTDAAKPIGEALVLAGLWEVTGTERYLPVQILQIAIDTLAVLLVYWLAMRLFKRRRTALIAAALYALFPPIAWLATDPYNDIWAVDFTLAIVAAFIASIDAEYRWRWLVLCGLMTGVGAYFRPNLLLIPPALAAATLFWSGWRRALPLAIVPLAIAALLLVPWTIRNAVIFHRFIPTSTGVGQNLWEGLGEVHNDFGAVLNDEVTYEQVHRVRPNLVYDSPAYDEYLRHRAIRAIEQHPLTYLTAVARRVVVSTVLVLQPTWMHAGTNLPAAYRSQTGGGLLSYAVHRPLDLIEVAFEPAVFVLAMLALALTWRARRRAHSLLGALVLVTLVPYWALHVEPRYVLPAAFAYCLWIAFGVDLGIDRLLARGGRREAQGDRGDILAGSAPAVRS
jgi:4-amino-4-deoxy-L-arabinose transferase-like glycosyltransferase